MKWYESWYYDVGTEKKYEIHIAFTTGEKDLKEATIKFVRSKGWIDSECNLYLYVSNGSTSVVVDGLVLNNRNTLTAYLQGILDGVSSNEAQVQFWRQQINSVYGMPPFKKESIKLMSTAIDDLKESQYSLESRISRLEEGFNNKAPVINETVDEISTLQHKVDELEAYIKFLNPYYPLVIDESTDLGDKKKKGWFKK